MGLIDRVPSQGVVFPGQLFHDEWCREMSLPGDGLVLPLPNPIYQPNTPKHPVCLARLSCGPFIRFLRTNSVS